MKTTLASTTTPTAQQPGRAAAEDVGLLLVQLGHRRGLDLTDPSRVTNPYAIGDGTQVCALDPELWFPDKGDAVLAPKAWCRSCQFREPCLIWAVQHYERGIWGGSSEIDRVRLRKAAGLPPGRGITSTPVTTRTRRKEQPDAPNRVAA